MFERIWAALFPRRTRRPGSGAPRGAARAMPAPTRAPGGETGRPPHGGAHLHTGGGRIAYDPEFDGHPDPGEVVWAWVPFQEDNTRGKDRPLLLLGYAAEQRYAGSAPDLLLAVMLSSQDHSSHRNWVPIGTGAWDRQRRPSAVRIDRLYAVPATAVRRQGAELDRQRFDVVAAAARAAHNLQ